MSRRLEKYAGGFPRGIGIYRIGGWKLPKPSVFDMKPCFLF